MRQNILFLSAVCFCVLIQTGNVAFGAPADTDGIIVDGDPIVTERNTQSLEKRVGRIRRKLGRQICHDMSDIGLGSRIHQLFKLYEAFCLDDKRYKARCWEYIPNTEDEAVDEFQCLPDEICGTEEFRNAWGILKTEVYCQQVQQKKLEVKANNKNIQQTNCSGGVTAKPAGQTLKIEFAGLFYSDAGHKSQATVQKAWIQTNKKGIVSTTYHNNRVYAQVMMSKGESAQLCFMRESKVDAAFGTLQWGFS